jgi:hypothetical protein
VLEFAYVYRKLLKQMLPLTKLCNNSKTSSRFVFFFSFFTDALHSNVNLRFLNAHLSVSSIFNPLFPSCKFAFIYIYIRNEKPTDVTISILFIYRRISTCLGPTGPSSGEFTQPFTQQFVQWLYCSGHVFCTYEHTEHAAGMVQPLNQQLYEQLCEFS